MKTGPIPFASNQERRDWFCIFRNQNRTIKIVELEEPVHFGSSHLLNTPSKSYSYATAAA